jgi:hypothetical protein
MLLHHHAPKFEKLCTIGMILYAENAFLEGKELQVVHVSRDAPVFWPP